MLNVGYRTARLMSIQLVDHNRPSWILNNFFIHSLSIILLFQVRTVGWVMLYFNSRFCEIFFFCWHANESISFRIASIQHEIYKRILSLVNYIETNSSVSSNGSLSLFFNVLRDVPSSYSKSLIMVDPSNGVYVELVNKMIDNCEFYRNPKYEPIAQIFYRTLAKNAFFPKSCPIRKVYTSDR